MSLSYRDGNPSVLLIALARRHGIDVADNITARELLARMQGKWLRKTEHQFQISPGPPQAEDLALLGHLGLVEEIMAPSDNYAGAFLLGATRPAVVKRLAHMLKQNVEFGTVYMLGGARRLDPVKESHTVLCTPAELPFKKDWQPPAMMPATEAEMMLMVFDQSDLPRRWPFFFVNTPLQSRPDGTARDPNTTDTMKEMLRFKPARGKYLVVSSQPYVARQTLNVKAAIPPELGIQLVGIGYEAPATTPLKAYLDETARLLQEELLAAK